MFTQVTLTILIWVPSNEKDEKKTIHVITYRDEMSTNRQMQVETGYQYAVTCEGRSWDSRIVPKVSDSKKTTTLKNLTSKTTVRSIKTEEQIRKESQNCKTKNLNAPFTEHIYTEKILQWKQILLKW